MTIYRILVRFASLTALLGVGALAACNDGAGDLPDEGSGGTGVTSSSSTTTSGASAGTGGAAVAELTWIAHLDPAAGELPEGLAVNPAGDSAFVGLAPTGKILAIRLSDGKVSPFGSIPTPPPNGGYLLGMTFDKAGNLFAGVASSSAAYQPGIFKVPAAGGPATLFASAPGLNFPNGLVFDDSGALLVTDSLSGIIFKIDTKGVATKWASDPLLVGDTKAACANGAAFPIGANGIVVANGAAYVVNTDKGSLLKIAINGDGTAGAISTFVPSDCATLGGADGLSADDDGSFLVAANGINAITRVTADGKASILVSKGKLDFPASTWITTGKGSKDLLITNAALKSAQTPGGMPTPGLLRFPLGG